MKKGILFLMMVLVFAMPIFGQEGSDKAISVEESQILESAGDTSLTFTVGGKEITIDGIEKDENIENLAVILTEITGYIESAIPEGQPEPSKPSWWITLVLGLGASFNKILVSGTKGIDILKGMFSDVDTRTIVIGIGMAIAFLYQLFVAGWKPLEVDFQAWAALSFGISGLSMILHEVIQKFKKKEVTTA